MFDRWYIIDNHMELLDMITWEPLSDSGVVFVQVQPYEKKRGVINVDGSVQPPPLHTHNIYVNDDLMADT